MAGPHVSVLLPCRDAAADLPDCITSLERQTGPELEVLAVDDGSTDATGELLRGWAARDPRVHLQSTAGVGIVRALALAAERARAPLLARMDADDIAHPERLQRQARVLEARPELAGCGTGFEYFPRSALGSGYLRYEAWLNSLSEPADLLRDLFVECPIAHPTLMIRSDAFADIGGYEDHGWPEDYDLVLRLHTAGFRLANLAEPLLRWRVRADRLSQRSDRYAPSAFRRCKVHYLPHFLPPGRELVVWGAGRVGKTLARELTRSRRPPDGFVDLDPRKIGERIHGAPVIGPSELGRRFPTGFVLVAVGSPGARDEIRRALAAEGREELRDYRAIA